jgi:urea carboxylase-associated protein 2
MVDVAGTGAASTGTLAGARVHARSQELIAPPTSTGRAQLPDDATGRMVWSVTVGPGDYTAHRLPRGTLLRIADIAGDACVQLLLHNAVQPAERLNVVDTVKVQWQAYLGTGALLLSDLGRVLMTLVADTSERHDCLCGCSNRAGNEVRYGDATAAGRHPSGRDLLALGVAKLGLSRLDVGPNVNLFKSVRVDDRGGLRLDGAIRPGTEVRLRAEMDVFVTVANTPHPLDDRSDYTSTPVQCVAWMPSADEPSAVGWRTSTPERRRAFENTDDFLAGLVP